MQGQTKIPDEDVPCSPCGSQSRGDEQFSEYHPFFLNHDIPWIPVDQDTYY